MKLVEAPDELHEYPYGVGVHLLPHAMAVWRIYDDTPRRLLCVRNDGREYGKTSRGTSAMLRGPHPDDDVPLSRVMILEGKP